MEGKRISHRLSYLVVLLLFAATACSPIVPQQSTSVDTEQIVETVLSRVESQMGQQADIVPVVHAASPAAVAGSEATGLQETLIRLYQQVNPSVVYIVVSS